MSIKGFAKAIPFTPAKRRVHRVHEAGSPDAGAVGERAGADMPARVAASDQALATIADFPLFGVGTGAWPESPVLPLESLYYFFRAAGTISYSS